jgi:hypothetical protein
VPVRTSDVLRSNFDEMGKVISSAQYKTARTRGGSMQHISELLAAFSILSFNQSCPMSAVPLAETS